MSRTPPWHEKVIALLRTGNAAAAILQIKVAPGVRELQQLQQGIAKAQLAGRWREVDLAVAEAIQALSAPRLHRSP